MMSDKPTQDKIDEAAELARAEQFLDALENADPADVRVTDAADLRRIGAAAAAIDGARAELAAAVAAARENGRSWGLVGMVLGVSKQAARERFALPRQRQSEAHDHVSTPAE